MGQVPLTLFPYRKLHFVGPKKNQDFFFFSGGKFWLMKVEFIGDEVIKVKALIKQRTFITMT